MSERYAVSTTADPLETLELRDEGARAVARVAPARGGMLTRFEVGGEPVLFLDEATFRDASKNVRGGVPLLFPIGGPLPEDRYRAGDASYSMKQHGFARGRAFTVLDASASDAGARVLLELTPDEASRAQYPFAWRLRAEYTLREGVLEVALEVRNEGASPLPVQPGTHPYFYLPEASKAGASVALTGTRAWDNVRRVEQPLALPVSLTVPELDLHILDGTATETTLQRPGLRPVHLAWSANQRHLVLWTLAGRDFLCIEPWSARGGALSRGDAPVVAPGAAERWSFTMRLA